ncbi:hypothetical protein AYO44_06760 [Planctomycetaceae bacterium SCGC AG-212-F19]|nr:hypothetical protein AYO44_06760 [Planctomycetaceae bacterium SCGC AG-212-F19]
MPLKLNVGLSRKLGEPNYGSRGASVNLEMELEAALVNEPLKLRHRITQLFNIVRSAVADEQKNGGSNGHEQGNGNGTTAPQHNPRVVRPVSPNQLKAIHVLARKGNVDLGRLLQEQCGARRLEDLTLLQASMIIDALKNMTRPGEPSTAPGVNGETYREEHLPCPY